jgi:hypothetical protein
VLLVQLSRQPLAARRAEAKSYEGFDEKANMDILRTALRRLLEPGLDHMADEYLDTLSDVVLRAKPDASTREAVHKVKAKLAEFRALPIPVKIEAWA